MHVPHRRSCSFVFSPSSRLTRPWLWSGRGSVVPQGVEEVDVDVALQSTVSRNSTQCLGRAPRHRRTYIRRFRRVFVDWDSVGRFVWRGCLGLSKRLGTLAAWISRPLEGRFRDDTRDWNCSLEGEPEAWLQLGEEESSSLVIIIFPSFLANFMACGRPAHLELDSLSLAW